MDRDERLHRIIDDFLDAVERGDRPSDSALLRSAPDLEDELREFLRDYHFVDDAVSPLREEEEPAIPLRFGGYEIEREVARGGMGVVYKARQVDLDRTVALKTILGGTLASKDIVERFRREARACGSLDHPNIVPLYDVGSWQGWNFYTMKYLEGGSLAAGRDAPVDDLRDAAELVETVARAVHYAHEHGVLHRDLKPANVLLDSAGRPHVSDFGLAAFLEELSGLTQTGDALGSPSYMAPEQAAGRTQAVSTRSDVYSLGAILYELMTGAPPFRASTPLETLRRVVEEDVEPPSKRRANVPRDLETICLTCLRKEPERRYGSAKELADELRRFLDGETIMARTPSAGERLLRWSRRNSVALIVWVVVIVSAVVTATFAAFWRAERDAALEIGRKYYIGEASRLRQTTEAGRRFAGLRHLAEAARVRPGLDARNEAIACLALADCEQDVSAAWDGFPEGTKAVAFDADFARYARAHGESISVRRVQDDVELARLAHSAARVDRLEFSPAGGSIVVHDVIGRSVGTVTVLPLAAAAEPYRPVDRVHPRAWSFLAESELATGAVDGTLAIHDLRSRRITARHAFVSDLIRVAATPDGRLVAAAPSGHVVQVLDRSTGEVREPRRFGHFVLDIAWHPHGEILAVCGDGSLDVELWNVETGEVAGTLRHANGVPELYFSPDGRLLATTCWDGRLRLWDPTTHELFVSTQTPYGGYRFAADSSFLGWGHDAPRLWTWRAAPPRELRELVRVSGAGVAFHPDGRLLAIATPSGVVLWDVVGDRRLCEFRIGNASSAYFAPDGSALVATTSDAVHRWSVRRESGPGGEHVALARNLRQAPPPGNAFGRSCLSGDGQWFAVVASTQQGAVAAVVDVDRPREPIVFPHHNAAHVALSNDGHWLGVGPFNGHAAGVYDVPSRQLVKTFDSSRARLCFSPDGARLFVVGRDSLEAVDMESWETLWRRKLFPPGMKFVAVSPSGNLVAVGETTQEVMLLDAATGTDLATLATLATPSVNDVCFGPNDRYVAVAARGVVCLWDLGVLRAGLGRLGLDWSPAATAPLEEPSASRLTVSVAE